ncbi:NAD(P)/FAD-dependent oxidoreductase [Patescibacteria group bacterium]
MEKRKIHDLVIIGAGPAGLSASVYASRYGIDNVIAGEISGGLTTETHEIGNWLGTEKITGFEFATNAANHAKNLGAEIKNLSVDQVTKKDELFDLLLSDGNTLNSKSILLAMGTKHRHLGVPGEKEFAGKGVSFCATCDGFFYRDKTVAVIGGSDSAASAAVYLSNIAKKVYIIYRGEELRAETFWKRSIEDSSKIEVIYSTNVKEIYGGDKLEGVILDFPRDGSDKLELDGLFIEIGLTPSTDIITDLGVDLDDEGYIKVEPDGRTSVVGVWAAGDITSGSNKFKQIVTAASEGAIATNGIQAYLQR